MGYYGIIYTVNAALLLIRGIYIYIVFTTEQSKNKSTNSVCCISEETKPECYFQKQLCLAQFLHDGVSFYICKLSTCIQSCLNALTLPSGPFLSKDNAPVLHTTALFRCSFNMLQWTQNKKQFRNVMPGARAQEFCILSCIMFSVLPLIRADKQSSQLHGQVRVPVRTANKLIHLDTYCLLQIGSSKRSLSRI